MLVKNAPDSTELPILRVAQKYQILQGKKQRIEPGYYESSAVEFLFIGPAEVLIDFSNSELKFSRNPTANWEMDFHYECRFEWHTFALMFDCKLIKIKSEGIIIAFVITLDMD